MKLKARPYDTPKASQYRCWGGFVDERGQHYVIDNSAYATTVWVARHLPVNVMTERWTTEIYPVKVPSKSWYPQGPRVIVRPCTEVELCKRI